MSHTKRVPKSDRKRLDGWENLSTGIGILGRDKRLGNSFSADIVDQSTAEDLWRGDDMIGRVIETIPDEMLREGWCVKVEEDKDLSEALESEGERIGLTEHLRDALSYARAYGGAGMLLGAEDGSKDLSLPLAEDRIRSFDWVTLFSPRELQPVRYYANPRAAKYGQISQYRIVPVDSPEGAATGDMPIVHESRIVRFGGVRTSRGAQLHNVHPGWDDSILTRLVRVVADFQSAWAGAGILTSDLSTPVLKIKGLAKILASATGDELAGRAKAIEMARSIANVTILDSEEEFKRETTTVTGLSDLLEKFMLRVAAAANMPVSLLMGQSPAGLNATGDSELRWFYNQVRGQQDRRLLPALTRIFSLLMASKAGPAKGKIAENWEIEFKPLWSLTEKEQAETRLIQAQADAIYLTNQVVTPQEIAKSRFGGDGYSTDTQIDTGLRDELLADEELQLQELGAGADPQPDPNAPPAPGAQPVQPPAPAQK